MLICFVHTPGIQPQVHRVDSEGPCYPVIAESRADSTYRFFAGRLVDSPSADTIPRSHPVSFSAADDWSFPDAEPDGSWIALKFDQERDALSIAADLFNVQRWFYHERGGTWYIANSLRYLHRIVPGLEIEWRAASYMLHLGYLPHRLTPLRDVFLLDVGEVLTVRGGSGTISRRARLPVGRISEHAPTDPAAAIGDTICDAVRRELQHCQRVILPLSGGLDSRFLLGCALEILPPEAITTLTFGWPTSFDYRIGTRLAQELGVRSVPLAMDQRPVGELLRENFATAEGMYYAVPDYPVGPFRDAIAPQSFVLSGYIGDLVFGSKEGDAPAAPAAGRESELRTIVHGARSLAPLTIVAPFLADPDFDPFHLDDDPEALPGRTLQERYDYWWFGTHVSNRTHYAVTPVRSRAFFMMPFIHQRVLKLAFSLSREQRIGCRAYVAAMQHRFPHLHHFPTKRNFGAGANRKPDLGITAVRAWRKVWSAVDDILGPRLNHILYRHPRQNYEHPRSLSEARHQPDVLTALGELKTLPVFESATLESARTAYLARRLDMNLLRGLLTVHQWLVHYGRRP